MTDVEQANNDWANEAASYNRKVIAEFRESGGQPIAGNPILLLHTTGAKSGRELVSPLVYHRDGDRLFIFGSANGADRHPAWYHNLAANPDLTIEIGADTRPMRATITTGAERDQIYAGQSERAPQFADYQGRTERVIPVIALDPA